MVIKCGENPQRLYGLVSLWQIMKPFHAQLFILMDAISGNLNFKGKLLTIKADKENPWDDENERANFNKLLPLWEDACIDLGLTASVATIRKLGKVLARGTNLENELYPLGDELQNRLIDEMNGKFFFSLTVEEAEHYNNPRKGWEKIIDRFPDVINDVEEMRKCFALSRYPGAVFHSLHVIEAGLLELGTFMDAKDPHSGWTAVSNRLDAIVGKKYDQRNDFEKQNFPFLEQVQATVEGLKNAWRNKISHAQGKLILLTTDFTPEIAEEIILATRAFMRRLAEGLPPAQS
jgi:hypothetical protein